MKEYLRKIVDGYVRFWKPIENVRDPAIVGLVISGILIYLLESAGYSNNLCFAGISIGILGVSEYAGVKYRRWKKG